MDARLGVKEVAGFAADERGAGRKLPCAARGRPALRGQARTRYLQVMKFAITYCTQ